MGDKIAKLSWMKIFHYARAHAAQFSLYVLSGGAAAIADFGGYIVLLELGMWYVTASIISSICGFFTAFLLNKFIVFKKKKSLMKHLAKYFIVDMTNTGLSTLLLYLLVEYLGFSEELGKVLAMGSVVFWNFFVYKYVVYI